MVAMVLPRALAVGEVDDENICLICQGLLRKPRNASSCDHSFCLSCYEEELREDARCPTCQEEVDVTKPLGCFPPFERMVNKTMVRCPTSLAAAVLEAAASPEVHSSTSTKPYSLGS